MHIAHVSVCVRACACVLVQAVLLAVGFLVVLLLQLPLAVKVGLGCLGHSATHSGSRRAARQGPYAWHASECVAPPDRAQWFLFANPPSIIIHTTPCRNAPQREAAAASERTAAACRVAHQRQAVHSADAVAAVAPLPLRIALMFHRLHARAHPACVMHPQVAVLARA